MSNLKDDLFSIGIQLKANNRNSRKWINIEETILNSILLAKDDRKIMSHILSWTDIYGDRLIAEKLIKIYKKMDLIKEDEIWFNAFFIYLTSKGDRRFKSLVKKYSKKQIPREDYKSALKLKKADPIFEKYNLLIPNGFINISAKNIATPEMLIKRNKTMKNRYLFGANWRSDIISAIQSGMKNPFQIKNTIGCSYDSAYRTFKEYQVTLL